MVGVLVSLALLVLLLLVLLVLLLLHPDKTVLVNWAYSTK